MRKKKKKNMILGRFEPRTLILYKNGLVRPIDHCTNESYILVCVVINSYNSCMIHGDYRVLTILVFRSVTKTLLYLFHNALDHNDSSALPGHFMRTIHGIDLIESTKACKEAKA